MKLKAITLCAHLEPHTAIRKASPKRDWIDATNGGAYRCLPLVMANQFGWELTLPCDVSAKWNGGAGMDAIEFYAGEDECAHSHFGNGILTFHVWSLFRTPSGINLMVTGPANVAKAGISPLEGLVETDWATMTFTMNWRFTIPGRTVTFYAGEPFCRIFPIPRGFVEHFELEELDYHALPIDERAAYEDWRNRRASWLSENHDPKTWMKDYFRLSYQKPGREHDRKCPMGGDKIDDDETQETEAT